MTHRLPSLRIRQCDCEQSNTVLCQAMCLAKCPKPLAERVLVESALYRLRRTGHGETYSRAFICLQGRRIGQVEGWASDCRGDLGPNDTWPTVGASPSGSLDQSPSVLELTNLTLGETAAQRDDMLRRYGLVLG